MIIYGPDNQALAPKEQYRQQFATVEAVHNDRILSSLFKIFDDTQDIFLEQCDLVERVSFNDNTYFLFRKRPYKNNRKGGAFSSALFITSLLVF